MGWNACAAAGERGGRVRLRPSTADRNAYPYPSAYTHHHALANRYAYPNHRTDADALPDRYAYPY